MTPRTKDFPPPSVSSSFPHVWELENDICEKFVRAILSLLIYYSRIHLLGGKAKVVVTSTSSSSSDLSDGDNSNSSNTMISSSAIAAAANSGSDSGNTSDYQRSTPSPRDQQEEEDSSNGKNPASPEADLGLGEDIKEEEEEEEEEEDSKPPFLSFAPSSFYAKRTLPFPRMDREVPSPVVVHPLPDSAALSRVDERCRHAVMAAVADPRTGLRDRLVLIRDARIMRSRPRVALGRARLRAREVLAADPEAVLDSDEASRDLFRGVSVGGSRSPRAWRQSPHCSPTKSPTTKLGNIGGSLIRPAVLRVESSSSPESSPKISSSKSSNSFSSSINPFRPPPLKSSFLFGGDGDFECVEPGDLVIASEEDEEEEEEEEEMEEEEEVPLPKAPEVKKESGN